MWEFCGGEWNEKGVLGDFFSIDLFECLRVELTKTFFLWIEGEIAESDSKGDGDEEYWILESTYLSLFSKNPDEKRKKIGSSKSKSDTFFIRKKV